MFICGPMELKYISLYYFLRIKVTENNFCYMGNRNKRPRHQPSSRVWRVNIIRNIHNYAVYKLRCAPSTIDWMLTIYKEDKGYRDYPII